MTRSCWRSTRRQNAGNFTKTSCRLNFDPDSFHTFTRPRIGRCYCCKRASRPSPVVNWPMRRTRRTSLTFKLTDWLFLYSEKNNDFCNRFYPFSNCVCNYCRIVTWTEVDFLIALTFLWHTSFVNCIVECLHRPQKLPHLHKIKWTVNISTDLSSALYL